MSRMSSRTRPRIVSVIGDATYELVVSPRAEAKLREVGEFVRHRGASSPGEDGLIAALRDADGVLTSWGVRLPERVIRETRLRIIGHAAGTVKWLPPLVWERGIAVTHAAPVIAVAVGEMALALTLACLRHIPAHDAAFKRHGTRGDESLQPRLLASRSLHELRVGIVGASATGREFLRLLRAFGDVEVWVADPHLSPAEAERLGVRQADLDELFAGCDVVSLHCPALPETRHLADAARLARMKDGAVLVNTARGALVDHDALLAELRSGRISAGLDVYLETLPAGDVPRSAYRELPNVIVTPGISGPAGTITRRLALFIAEEFERFFAGRPLVKPVTADMLSYVA
jgi:phosphoglycerate dehydrogenase-like enzyme